MMTAAGYVKTVEADLVPDPGSRWPWGGRGQAKSDDLVSHIIFTTAHAYLLFFSNRGEVPAAAMDVPEPIERQEHPHRQPAAAGVQREHPAPSSTPAPSWASATSSSPPAKGR